MRHAGPKDPLRIRHDLEAAPIVEPHRPQGPPHNFGRHVGQHRPQRLAIAQLEGGMGHLPGQLLHPLHGVRRDGSNPQEAVGGGQHLLHERAPGEHWHPHLQRHVKEDRHQVVVHAHRAELLPGDRKGDKVVAAHREEAPAAGGQPGDDLPHGDAGVLDTGAELGDKLHGHLPRLAKVLQRAEVQNLAAHLQGERQPVPPGLRQEKMKEPVEVRVGNPGQRWEELIDVHKAQPSVRRVAPAHDQRSRKVVPLSPVALDAIDPVDVVEGGAALTPGEHIVPGVNEVGARQQAGQVAEVVCVVQDGGIGRHRTQVVVEESAAQPHVLQVAACPLEDVLHAPHAARLDDGPELLEVRAERGAEAGVELQPVKVAQDLHYALLDPRHGHPEAVQALHRPRGQEVPDGLPHAQQKDALPVYAHAGALAKLDYAVDDVVVDKVAGHNPVAPAGLEAEHKAQEVEELHPIARGAANRVHLVHANELPLLPQLVHHPGAELVALQVGLNSRAGLLEHAGVDASDERAHQAHHLVLIHPAQLVQLERGPVLAEVGDIPDHPLHALGGQHQLTLPHHLAHAPAGVQQDPIQVHHRAPDARPRVAHGATVDAHGATVTLGFLIHVDPL
eukprot:767463-Hanusia_phi.AAC.10